MNSSSEYEPTEMAPRDATEVLIIGAGPVGIALACELLQEKVAVRVVERGSVDPHDDRHSRAILILPRSLELLSRIGVTDQLIEAGEKVPSIEYFSEGKSLGSAHMDRMTDTPYPYILSLPQRITESVLQQRFFELGGSIEYDTEMVGLKIGDHHTSPMATLRRSDGTSDTVSAGYVVGADGARSSVRTSLGEELSGDATDVTYLIADAEISGDVEPHAQYFYSSAGILTIIPMRDGVYRIAANIPHGSSNSDSSWQAVLQDCVDVRAKRDFRIHEPTYARTVRPICGRVDHMRQARCFLVGDAAHVVTPAGGQGLNLGFQDAFNLGWRLSGVVNGALPASALDAFDHERRTAAIRTSATTARIIKYALIRGRLRIRLRDMIFYLSTRTGLVQSHVVPLLTQTDVRYRVKGRRARPFTIDGMRLPLFDRSGSALVGGYTTVVWGDDRSGAKRLRTAEAIRAHVPSHIDVLDVRAQPTLWNHTTIGTVRRRPFIALVRPDGHVDYATGLRNARGLAARLSEVLVSRTVGGGTPTPTLDTQTMHGNSTAEEVLR